MSAYMCDGIHFDVLLKGGLILTDVERVSWFVVDPYELPTMPEIRKAHRELTHETVDVIGHSWCEPTSRVFAPDTPTPIAAA